MRSAPLALATVVVLLLLLLYAVASTAAGDAGKKSCKDKGDAHADDGKDKEPDEIKPTTEPPPPCGEYGFRCLDAHTYQVCAYTDIDDETEDAAETHECPEDMECDETIQEYCTPLTPMPSFNTTQHTCDQRKRKRMQPEDADDAMSGFQCTSFGMFPGEWGGDEMGVNGEVVWRSLCVCD